MSDEKRIINFSQAIREAIAEEIKRDENVFLMGEDVGNWGNLYGVTRGLLEEFGPDRIMDTPISEAGFTGCGIGSAISGMRPIVEIMYIDFITIAIDQIVNHAAKLKYLSAGELKVPIVIRTQGGVGRRNAAQHSQSLENWFCHIPGLVVVMPSSPYSAKGLLKSAIRNDNPVIFIEHKALYNEPKEYVPESEYLIPLGKAEIKKEGRDITLIATSWMLERTLKVANELQKDGISAEVIDPQTLVPLDKETIFNSVKKTGKCVVIHEAPKTGGWAGEVISLIVENVFEYLDAPPKRVCGLDWIVPYGKELEHVGIPSEKDIFSTVLTLCK